MIQEFLTYQEKNKGLSEQTIHGYRKDLKNFVNFAKERGLRWSTITAQDMDEYVRNEDACGMAARTIKLRVEVVRLLFTWAQHKGYLNENPARYTQTPKIQDTLRRAEDPTRLEAYLKTPSLTREAYIIHAVTAIIYETGIRIGELLRIEGRDIDTQERRIFIKGKGATERYVYYGDKAAAYLQAMSQRVGRCLQETDFEIRMAMARELPGCHPHAIRHTFACRMINAGMPLKTLATLMGHKHESTTEIYARIATDKAREEYNKYN